MSRCTALNTRYSEISARLLIKPDTSEQLVELQTFVDEVPTELTDMHNKFHGPGARPWLFVLCPFVCERAPNHFSK